jgi:hypothetical protein
MTLELSDDGMSGRGARGTSAGTQGRNRTCWLCGRRPAGGAELRMLHGRLRLCCAACARTLGVPGRYLG